MPHSPHSPPSWQPSASTSAESHACPHRTPPPAAHGQALTENPLYHESLGAPNPSQEARAPGVSVSLLLTAPASLPIPSKGKKVKGKKVKTTNLQCAMLIPLLQEISAAPWISRFSRYLVGAPMPQDWFYNSPRNIYRAVFTAVLVRLIYKRKVGGKHL